jgi:hypothetical protein
MKTKTLLPELLGPMMHDADNLALDNEELAFFRLTCDLFPGPESPLRFLEEADAEPNDPEKTFARLTERHLLAAAGNAATQNVRDRLQPVAECSARVLWTIRQKNRTVTRDFYIANGACVEYGRSNANEHSFGSPRPESALALELAQQFVIRKNTSGRLLKMSARDYLVFAVFVRDIRATATPKPGNESMSVAEVLAYFDEPEPGRALKLSDQSWENSIAELTRSGILRKQPSGYELDASLHALAREIIADHQHTVVRFDFLDDQWLVREVSLYPTPESVFRLGTEPDGSVVIEELSMRSLADLLASITSTLPNLLNADAAPTLHSR